MVLARRREKRLLEQAKEEGRREALQESEKRWKTWYDSLPEEIKKNQPPPPEKE